MDDKFTELIIQEYEEESDRFQQMLAMLNDIGEELTPAEVAFVDRIMKNAIERRTRHNKWVQESERRRANLRTSQETMEFMAQNLANIEREAEELRSMTSALKTIVQLHIKPA